jgi:hypothetical protein
MERLEALEDAERIPFKNQYNRWPSSLTFEKPDVKTPLKTKIHPKHRLQSRDHYYVNNPWQAVFGGGFLFVFFRQRKLTNV